MVSSEPLVPAGSITRPHSTTIDVADVAWATDPLPEVPSREALEALLPRLPFQHRREATSAVSGATGVVEACSRYHGTLAARIHFHAVVAALHRAFNDHRPLVLSPDMLWLMVAQGFANHVNANAEELRHKFVQHSSKVKIKVQMDDFRKGSPDNPWPEVFGEFSSRIREHIGTTTHDLLVPTFSTTGPVERAASEIVLLDAMQRYFEYQGVSSCGIPQIVLEGTPDDWEMLAERARRLSDFGLGWWTEILTPILDEFVAASHGRANVPFWNSIYKFNGRSGGPNVDGWINAFLPYLKDHDTGQASRRNELLARGGQAIKDVFSPFQRTEQRCYAHGPMYEDLPSGLARAPFTWKYFGDEFQMEFLGGFVGVRQDSETLRLRPEIGWAVRDDPTA